MTLHMSLLPAEPVLAYRQEPQICYVLVTLEAHSGSVRQQAANWVLVADASRSMRIPIISEAQFRQLVRTGGAHEVLVDGVPVWQFTAPVPPEIEAVSPSAIDHVIHALYTLVEQLQEHDRLALIACAEDAVLLASGTGRDGRAALLQSVGRLKEVSLGEQTDLARGMQMGLQQLRQQSGGSASVRRLVLLTDGFTQNPDVCRELAHQAASEGIVVSTLGLGGDFQEDLLTALADICGGQAVFLRQADEIAQAVAHELVSARTVAAHALTLSFECSREVELRRATSISPTLASLTPVHSAPNQFRLHLGDLEPQAPARILLELVAPPIRHTSDQPVRRVRLARVAAMSESPATTANLDIIAAYAAQAATPPAVVLDAAARANAARLQLRALEAAANGDQADAVRLLRSATARLSELGEHGLADLAQQEIAALEHTGHTTRLGAKELTYATRRLGKSQ
jgi:Mg-chelatase subunit ChlD